MTSKSNIKSERGSHTSGCDEWSEDVTETEKQPQQPQELSDSKDNKRILLSKLLLFFVMVGSAAGLAALTHSFATRIERSKFENQFENDAQEIIRMAESNIRQTFMMVEGFSTSVTALSQFGNESFPFLTIPDFSIRARDLLDVSRASWFCYTPIIEGKDGEAFGNYTVKNQAWLQDVFEASGFENRTAEPIPSGVWRFEISDDPNMPWIPVPENGPGPYYVNYQMYPWFDMMGIGMNLFVNYNMGSFPVFAMTFEMVIESRKPLLTEMTNMSMFGRQNAPDVVPSPESSLIQPIFRDNKDGKSEIIGFLQVSLPWDIYFMDVLSDINHKIHIKVNSSCGQSGHFRVEGPAAYAIREDDHDMESFEDISVLVDFATFSRTNTCDFTLQIAPSEVMQEAFMTSLPIYLTVGVVVLFVFTSAVFVLYDVLIQLRQRKVMTAATKTHAIVSSLFPANVHDRLLGLNGDAKLKMNPLLPGHKFGANSIAMFTPKQSSLADFYPECTVMFADICGFAAWSSTRDPAQVFTLLESIFGAFDELGRTKRILKVESVKDSYLAVCGVPTPMADHAIRMARYTLNCRQRMKELVDYLETSLGPGTSSLSMRFGLHSGPVTAGVLRGVRKARFQLFGDTVNTAARMESTCLPDRIQCSEETAELLKKLDKGHWLSKRESCVTAKGKGNLQTFWIGTQSNETPDTSPMHYQSDPSKGFLNPKLQRIVNWNTELLAKMLRQIVAQRSLHGEIDREMSILTDNDGPKEGTVLDEVIEILPLPEYKAASDDEAAEREQVKLDTEVMTQLHDYISQIASLYQDNPFHNYQHASHVTLSVSKMLSRIVSPDAHQNVPNREQTNFREQIYGISDPLTQFTIVLSALIHDVEHQGVTNAVLVNEGIDLAARYNNKSVAEQNSVDRAWEILMQPKYKELQACIFSTQEELARFRSILVNVVLATDIMDKDLGAARKARWAKAFSEDKVGSLSIEDINRKATIVLEHLIQASDVAHTMQHWHVFLTWNEKLFCEMYQAYKAGRIDKDPSEFWYEGETGFFDFYVIPLAKKLKECGVFGVSSDEYLGYALANRAEWKAKGQEVVERYIARHVVCNLEDDEHHSIRSRFKSGPWGSGSETDISSDEGVNMDATAACQQGSKGDYEREIAV